MNMQKRFLLSLLIVALLATVVQAQDVAVQVSPDQSTIKLNETAYFQLTVSNAGPEKTFEIYSPDVAWDLSTNPAEDRLLAVPAGGRVSTQVLVRPLYVTPGYYVLPIHVRAVGTNEVKRAHVLIGVNSLSEPPRDYEPAVRVKTVVPTRVDPRDGLPVQVQIENQNRKTLESVRIKLVSEHVTGEQETSLEPLESKTLIFEFGLDPRASPQESYISTSTFITTGGKTYRFDAEPIPYNIVSYGDVREEVTEEDGFLSKTKRITLINDGNTPRVYTYRVPKPFLGGLFASSDPEARETTVDGNTQWEWEFYFAVGESKELRLVTSYRIILWVILLTIGGLGAYFMFRSPIVVRKSAMILETKEEGISELKVLIELRNRSHRPVKSVAIIDKVPSLVSISPKHEMGTLEPSKIVKDAAGDSLVKWEIEELDGLEERVLSYKIRSKFSILGSLQLPVAMSTFESTSGARRSTKSNISQIGFGH